jgi:hypothetical protein
VGELKIIVQQHHGMVETRAEQATHEIIPDVSQEEDDGDYCRTIQEQVFIEPQDMMFLALLLTALHVNTPAQSSSALQGCGNQSTAIFARDQSAVALVDTEYVASAGQNDACSLVVLP